METDPGGMVGIWRELQERYPLLGRVVVHAIAQEKAEAFPGFFGLFLPALDAKESAPCCFVLPRRGQMARLAAVVFGLSIFRREFNALTIEYANQKFAEGQRVRVLPGKQVFAFGGFWPAQPDKFRLCTLDGLGSRTFAANNVLRLEPTPLFGNLSLFKNRVLCLDEQSQFAEFKERCCFQSLFQSEFHSRLQRRGLEPVVNLAELLPFAWLRDSGRENAQFSKTEIR
jgi:hypothetical protein